MFNKYFEKPSTYLYLITFILVLFTFIQERRIDNFYDSYNFHPLEEPFLFEKDLEQSYEFTINYEGKYNIMIDFQKNINYDTLMKYSGLNIMDMENNDTTLFIDWQIKNSDSLIIDKNEPHKTNRSISSSTVFTRYIGKTSFDSIGTYTITLISNKTAEILTPTKPVVHIECADMKYYEYGWSSLWLWVFSISLLLFSVFVFIYQLWVMSLKSSH